MKKKIMVIEDDASINQGIELILGTADYEFTHYFSLSEIRSSDAPDLIVLDICLPDGNGLDFLKKLRRHSQVPVLILTADDTEMAEVMGLELGADEYITKPFSVMAFRLRVRKILADKSREPAGNAVRERESLYLDFERLVFKKNGEELDLSKTEIRLLRYFVENAGITLSREKILDYVWQVSESVDENALSVSVKRLRDKLEDGERKFIYTVYGIGYVWKWA